MHVMDVLSASSLLFSACAGRTSALSSCGRILNKEPWSPEEVALVEELTTQDRAGAGESPPAGGDPAAGRLGARVQ